MKRIRLAALIVFAMLMLVSLAFAGDKGSCSTKSTSAAAGCGASCGSCVGDPTCCGGMSSCDWDNSHWKGLKYSENGELRKDLSEKQARKVAAQYLKKTESAKGRVVSVDEKENCYNISIQPKGTDTIQKIDVNKKTAAVRKLNL